ncbi:MAG TPA: hypothetical protein VIN09_14150 [Chloroflexota bacterium]
MSTKWLAYVLLIVSVVGFAVVLQGFRTFKKRLRRALIVGGVAYLGVTVARLVQASPDAQRVLDLAIALSGLVAVWAVLWVVTTLVQRRNRRRAAPAGPDVERQDAPPRH